MSSPLPDFEQPPVIETAIGVVFLPIEGWTLSQFARFGRYVEEDYPDADPQERIIATPIEQFGVAPQPTVLNLQTAPGLWWFVNQARGRLIQLQRDRFVHNWRRTNPEEPYPHYVQTREEFRSAWLNYLSFLEKEGLSAPTVLQVEIDYVNHIERGPGWQEPSDLSRVTPLIGRLPQGFLPNPEGIQLGVRYLMPANRGRLHISLLPAIRNSDKVELLQLTVSAHGRPAGSDIDSVMDWCDLGHEWIVRGFADFTTTEAHSIWRRIR